MQTYATSRTFLPEVREDERRARGRHVPHPDAHVPADLMTPEELLIAAEEQAAAETAAQLPEKQFVMAGGGQHGLPRSLMRLSYLR
ncbi:MAG TPA: hypothetical protein VMC43_02490 [Candidatus Paceibacterota bacterium]|nr:hypothetical protein [Candidatus Paceibacterota bacterium]